MSHSAPDHDPYRPPNEQNEPSEDDGHRGVGMVLFLLVVTLGIYGTYWLWERRNFLLQRKIFLRIGPLALSLLFVLDVASLAAIFTPSLAGVADVLRIVDLVVRLAALFAMRDALNAWAASVGAPGPRSAPGTFFLGVLYLQHSMNVIARRVADARALAQPSGQSSIDST